MKQDSLSETPSQTPWLILFDGVCGWCTGWVRFLLKHDSHKRFQFAPLQSPLGRQRLARNDCSTDCFETFMLITPEGYFTKSSAALRIARHLGGFWVALYVFILVPRILRDGLYDVMARYRYQLRGTLTNCYRPPKEYQDRFLYDV